MRKQGIKLWADGSPWVGTAALSRIRTWIRRTGAGRRDPLGPVRDESAMNYTRDRTRCLAGQVRASGLADGVPRQRRRQGWTWSSMPTNSALNVHEPDRHRPPVAGRASAAAPGPISSRGWPRSGVFPSLGPFQFIYWGDLLDGEPCSHPRSARSGCVSATQLDAGRVRVVPQRRVGEPADSAAEHPGGGHSAQRRPAPCTDKNQVISLDAGPGRADRGRCPHRAP